MAQAQTHHAITTTITTCAGAAANAHQGQSHNHIMQVDMAPAQKTSNVIWGFGSLMVVGLVWQVHELGALKAAG